MDKLRDKFDKLRTNVERGVESVQYAINPDHRHDEAHEKAEDDERLEIAKSHRFESFADVREGNEVKWYISGHDYFFALSEILEQAKHTIWIADWWLTPELYLRRPPAQHEDYRLDRLLLRKAEQGVKVFVMVYKEVTQAMTMSSAHTKHFLEDLHQNIAVMRHPDHLGGEMQAYWSHHEKIVVVDSAQGGIACIGGLDLCFGRWDLKGNYPLADVHPTDFGRTLFPGQDYNNARIQDFQSVDKWVSNQQSRLDAPRMPWSDIHSMMIGPAVLDVAQHFVEHFIRDLKYKHDSRYPLLAFPHSDGDFEFRHPHLQRFRDAGHRFHLHHHRDEEGESDPERPMSRAVRRGTDKVQVVRSSADWSHGIKPKESSIQTAYCQLIRESRHYVFIMNQFFITSTDEGKGPVENQIGRAIVERVLSAARDGKKFKVVVLIPAIPGFAGDLKGNSGTLAIMGAQYLSISRGGHSIMEEIERAGYNPHDYVEFYNLRSYDRLNNDPDRLRKMAERSGISFEQAQAALARVYLGKDALESELDKNKEVTFVVPREGGEVDSLDAKEASKAENANPTIKLPLPRSYDEACEIVRRFQEADEVREQISDSVAHHAMAGQGSLLDEPWTGTEESERNAWVTEETYIHSKLMIVDDLRVIIGSANINERSQLGDRDSEIACVYEDEDLIESKMAGRPFMASRFAATLRRAIYKEHLGLSAPEFSPVRGEEPVTAAMKPVEVPHVDETATTEDQLVMDPLDLQTEVLVKNTAARNAEIFDAVFHCVPTNEITNWDEYKNYVPQKPIKPGHVATTDMPVRFIREQLNQVRGHLVPLPLNFLAHERLLALDVEVNPLTLAIYL
ncbi:hypothetical protein JCM8097_003276 [Rhodosporidiobolus ruineniae]